MGWFKKQNGWQLQHTDASESVHVIAPCLFLVTHPADVRQASRGRPSDSVNTDCNA